MNFLTIQKRAKIYAKYYISTTNLKDYLEATNSQGLKKSEAELAWESLDQYEDIRPIIV